MYLERIPTASGDRYLGRPGIPPIVYPF